MDHIRRYIYSNEFFPNYPKDFIIIRISNISKSRIKKNWRFWVSSNEAVRRSLTIKNGSKATVLWKPDFSDAIEVFARRDSWPFFFVRAFFLFSIINFDSNDWFLFWATSHSGPFFISFLIGQAQVRKENRRKTAKIKHRRLEIKGLPTTFLWSIIWPISSRKLFYALRSLRNVKLDTAATAQCADAKSVSNTQHNGFVLPVSGKQIFWTKTDHVHTILPFTVKLSGVMYKDKRRMYHIFGIEINSSRAFL